MVPERQSLIQPILESIENEDMRELCFTIADSFPEYIWKVAASSSGKYHPITDLGEGGLMRHQIATTRFCNYKLNLEQYKNKFGSKERDALRIACFCHDGRKNGEEDCGHTLHEHPALMADIIEKYYDIFPMLKTELDIIASSIRSHMGEWNTSKKSSVVLPKPQTVYEEFVHECDYLASRKDVELQFNDWKRPALPDIDTYTLNFGKHNGELLIEVAKNDPNYIMWLKETIGREPLRTLLTQI